MQDDSRIQSMLFEYETTNRTDFRPYQLGAPILTEFKEKPSRSNIKHSPLKYTHTLTDWKTPGIPFHLFHKPRPITGETPYEVQKPYFKPKDEGLQHAIETRPRLVMTPAVSLDDIEDTKAREIFVDDIYTSEMTREQREAVRPYFRVAAPFPAQPDKANPLSLPKPVPPVVSHEWRLESVGWDGKQLRAYCDSTQRFWLSTDPPKCRACDESRQMNTHAKELCQMKLGRALNKR